MNDCNSLSFVGQTHLDFGGKRFLQLLQAHSFSFWHHEMSEKQLKNHKKGEEGEYRPAWKCINNNLS